MSGLARVLGRRGSWRRRAQMRQLRRLALIIVPAFATGFLAVVIIADRLPRTNPGGAVLEVGVGASRIDALVGGVMDEASFLSEPEVVPARALPAGDGLARPSATPADEQAEEAALAVTPPSAAAAAEVPRQPKRRVQLAALKNERDARAAWARLQKAYPDLLGRFEPVFQPPDGRAKLWRIQVAIGGDAEARRFCTEVKPRGLDCLVVVDKVHGAR